MAANAVELTAEQAWFVADALGAGSFPWVLAITPPYSEHAQRVGGRRPGCLRSWRRLGVMTEDGVIDPAVRQWVTTTCRPRRWLELRFVSGSGNMLRGHVARQDVHTDERTVALRSGGLVTFTALDVDHPQALVPILTAGLSRRSPAQFEEFTIPARIGARADEQLRNGAALADVIDFLGIPPTARAVVEAAYSPGRTYVEIVAGDHRDGHRVTTDVGVSIVDTQAGRVLVYSVEGLRRRVGLDIHLRHPTGDRHRDRKAHRHAARRRVVPAVATDPRLRPRPENGRPAMSSDSQLTGTTSLAAMPIVRVAVLAAGGNGGRVTDMALPTELPLREILPAVRRMALPVADDAEHTSPVALSLAPVGGAPFSLDATLDTVGVVDGDLLALQPVPAGPPAPRIVEDIGDAAVIFSAAREKPWGASHIERGAGIAVVGLILIATALSAVHRATVGGNAGLFAASGIAVLTVLAAMLTRTRSPRLATALSVTALVPIAAALGLAVPGEFGASAGTARRRRCDGVVDRQHHSRRTGDRRFHRGNRCRVGRPAHRGGRRDLGTELSDRRICAGRAGTSGHRPGRPVLRPVVAPAGAGDPRAG